MMKRRHLVLLIVLLPVTLWAQDRRLHMLRTGSGEAVERKPVVAVLAALDPEARFSCDDDRLKVLLSPTVEPTELMVALEQGGAGRFLLMNVKDRDADRSLSDPLAHFPVMVNTGDATADEAAFAAAKTAWREAYPAEYEWYMESLQPNTNGHGTPATDH